MRNVEHIWREIPSMTGGQTQLLMYKPRDLRQQVLLLHLHRHLLAKGVIPKSVTQCLSAMPGSFSSESLQLQYLLSTKFSQTTLQELPQWSSIIQNWSFLKYCSNLSDEQFLKKTVTVVGLHSQEMQVTFFDRIAQQLLQLIIGKQALLADMAMINFRDSKVAFEVKPLLSLLCLLTPKTLFSIIIQNCHLPIALATGKQVQCLYSNRQLQFAVKQSPPFSTFLKVLFRIILSKVHLLSVGQQKALMESSFRYYFLHYHDKQHEAVDIFISCFNAVTESVRFALTEQFVLFLHVARKIGQNKFVNLLLEKSAWLRQIDQKTSHKKKIGYALESIDPFPSSIPQKIQINRGSKVNRYIECIEDHSFIFLRINVEELDITIHIDFQTDYLTVPSRPFIPITFQKVSKGFRKTLIMPERGIYSIQFDNSYSWMNGKVINYERLILNPISYTSNHRFPFLENYYLGTAMTAVTEQHLISIHNTTTQVHIRKRDTILSFIIQESGIEKYRYETDSSARFLQRLSQLKEEKPNYRLLINNETITNITTIQNVLNGASTKKDSARKKEQQVLIEIPLKY